MEPTDPNARTYANGTHASTHGYAVTQKQSCKCSRVTRQQCEFTCRVGNAEYKKRRLGSVKCGVWGVKCESRV